MKLGVILARGGSKRIPKKNIKSFLGRPVISYAIQAAKNSNLFDKIIISTDSDEIAKVAINQGVEAPFLRPDELAGDHATTDEAFIHAIKSFKNDIKYACCLYPVTPLLTAKHLEDSFKILSKFNATSSFPVAESPFPYQRGLQVKNKRIYPLDKKMSLKRTQDLENIFYDLGQFYWVNVKKYLEEGRVWSSESTPLVLDKYELIDIDDLKDWKFAEEIYKLRNLN
jgi:pseudaminic acid cytidylyltransferase